MTRRSRRITLLFSVARAPLQQGQRNVVVPNVGNELATQQRDRLWSLNCSYLWLTAGDKTPR